MYRYLLILSFFFQLNSLMAQSSPYQCADIKSSQKGWLVMIVFLQKMKNPPFKKNQHPLKKKKKILSFDRKKMN